jgi:predicted O-methyltransferase YrrM
MASLWNPRRFLYRTLLNRRALDRLSAMDLAMARRTAAALNRTLNDESSAEEALWFSRIESMREQLNRSTEQTVFMDYGAGSADAGLNESEMAGGRRKVITVGEMCRSASKSRVWGTLLFHLVREIKPSACLEMGTCMGVSGAYQSAALELNGHGRMVTLEGSPSLSDIARNNFRTLNLSRILTVAGRFQDTLEEVLKDLAPVDIAFVDGHHDGRATLAYFEQLQPHLAPDSLLIFDDIAWSGGMKNAWRTIMAHPKTTISVDLFSVGLCILSNGSPLRKTFRALLN